MTDFQAVVWLRVLQMLCAVVVMLIGAAMIWKFGDRAKEGNVKFSAGKIASMEFRQVTTGLIVIGFGIVLMLAAIQKPLSHTVRNGADEVAAVIAPNEDITVGSPAP